MKPIRSLAIASFALPALLLAACNVGTLLQFSGLASVDLNNLEVAREAFKDAQKHVASIEDQVTNAEVKDALTSASTALEDYVTYADDQLMDPAKVDSSALADRVDTLTARTSELSKTCLS